jgi:cysteate synthase
MARPLPPSAVPEATSYRLRCNACGTSHPDDRYRLTCCDGGLLIGEYPVEFAPYRSAEGLWRHLDWLPVDDPGEPVGGVTWRSEGLADELGLTDLWISFNGWWPERGANCPTCTFKDLEVAPTFQRLRERGAEGVVVASAGNTGRSFAHLDRHGGFPVLVIVAEHHVDRIWSPGAPHADSTTVVGVHGADYNDAIAIANEVAPAVGYQVEGGVKNVARRDGIGTLLLDAVLTMGRMPSHYVQGVGGGPGPIGVWGMAQRLIATGNWGERAPRFHLAQNDVHAPVHAAWTAGRDHLVPEDFPAGPVDAYADVLVNRSPAYAVRGGLHDVLAATEGCTWAVPAQAAAHAAERFEALEGIDLMEPAAIAVAALRHAVAAGEVQRDDTVLLGATGGGLARLQADQPLVPPAAAAIVDRSTAVDDIVALVKDRRA